MLTTYSKNLLAVIITAANLLFLNAIYCTIPYVDFDTSMGIEKKWYKKCYPKTLRAPVDECREFMIFLKKLYNKNNLAKVQAAAQPIIPKIIHQIWLGPHQPPAIFKKSQASIQKYFPDWEYKLWTDKDIPGLKLYNQKYYDLSKNYGERADIVRYEILYAFGGLYLDVDFVCLKSFDILHHSYDFYTALLPIKCAEFLANGVMGSVPGHPILKDCIETVAHDWELSDNILLRVGPYHFQKSFWKVGLWYQGPYIAFPRSFFFPIDFLEKHPITAEYVKKILRPETFAVHYWAHSWAHADRK